MGETDSLAILATSDIMGDVHSYIKKVVTMDKNYENLIKQGSLVAALFGLAYVLRGFVLRKLWMWFITPVCGCPTPNLPTAIGLVIIVGLFGSLLEQFVSGSGGKTMPEQAYRGGILLNHLFMRPLILWAFGFVVHLMA